MRVLNGYLASKSEGQPLVYKLLPPKFLPLSSHPSSLYDEPRKEVSLECLLRAKMEDNELKFFVRNEGGGVGQRGEEEERVLGGSW